MYIDGSFVTVKLEPRDYDACWDIDGVNVEALDSVFLDFSKGRRAQKRKSRRILPRPAARRRKRKNVLGILPDGQSDRTIKRNCGVEPSGG